ncbi:Uncharacterised protein [Mycobacteroides abscessus subsp. abscessus]|nr:Uncharacterised protein [Mycobacteroides abscessus subsp. abscessus]
MLDTDQLRHRGFGPRLRAGERAQRGAQTEQTAGLRVAQHLSEHRQLLVVDATG